MSAVILESKKIKSVTISIFPIYLQEVIGADAMILIFWMLSFKPAFSLYSSTFIKKLFSSSSFSAIGWLLIFLRLLIFLLVIDISEVTGISFGNLDSSLWFIQPSISHAVLCI